jgi:hypothetical protein
VVDRTLVHDNSFLRRGHANMAVGNLSEKLPRAQYRHQLENHCSAINFRRGISSVGYLLMSLDGICLRKISKPR